MKDYEQITLLDILPKQLAPGDTTADPELIGRPISWEEACNSIGNTILFKRVLQSQTYFEALIPEEHYTNNGCDHLICYDGTKHRALLDHDLYAEGFLFEMT